jgi:hypothetical protein
MKKGAPPAKSTIVLHICEFDEVFFICLQIFEIPDSHNGHAGLLSYHSYREKGTVNISFCLPFHTALKPLDVTFYRCLNAPFYRECDLFMKTRHLMMICCDLAHSQTASTKRGTSQFEVTGIYPLNLNISSAVFLALTML